MGCQDEYLMNIKIQTQIQKCKAEPACGQHFEGQAEKGKDQSSEQMTVNTLEMNLETNHQQLLGKDGGK